MLVINSLHVFCDLETGLSRVPFGNQVSERQYPCKCNLSITSNGSVSNYPVVGKNLATQ